MTTFQATPSTLLVIGGGMAGCAAIVGFRKYDKKTPIVLVEPKDFSEVYWASYRSPFERWVAEGSTIPLEPWCTKHNVKHHRSTVDKLTKTQAFLKDGLTIDYTVCLVSTGAGYKGGKMFGRGVTDVPVTREQRLATLEKDGEDLLNESSVVIVGGGLIGCELAGDLAVYASMQDKNPKITLVHSGPQLSHDNMTKAASTMLQNKLEKLGVTIVLNEKCVEQDGKVVLTKSGNTLQADRAIFTIGLVPINSFLVEGDFPDALSEKGWVDTDDFFRVKNGGDRLFGFGDCCTTLDNAGAKVVENMFVVGKNLKIALDAAALQTSATAQNLKRSIVSSWMVICTIGPKDGIFQTPLFHTQYIVPTIKNKTMLFFAKDPIYS